MEGNCLVRRAAIDGPTDLHTDLLLRFTTNAAAWKCEVRRLNGRLRIVEYGVVANFVSARDLRIFRNTGLACRLVRANKSAATMGTGHPSLSGIHDSHAASGLGVRTSDQG